VFVTPDGVLHGRDEIRALFEELLPALPRPSNSEMKHQHIDGEVAYIVWAGQSEQLDVSFATDTFVVRDGKIVLQTFAAQMEARPGQAPAHAAHDPAYEAR
jgi:hypothetical protein